jgi:hypothetical protein
VWPACDSIEKEIKLSLISSMTVDDLLVSYAPCRLIDIHNPAQGIVACVAARRSSTHPLHDLLAGRVGLHLLYQNTSSSFTTFISQHGSSFNIMRAKSVTNLRLSRGPFQRHVCANSQIVRRNLQFHDR